MEAGELGGAPLQVDDVHRRAGAGGRRDHVHRVAGDDDVVGQGEDAEIGVLAVAVPDLRRQAGAAAAQDLLVATAGAPRGRAHQATAVHPPRRTIVGEGKSLSVLVDLRGSRTIQNTNTLTTTSY